MSGGAGPARRRDAEGTRARIFRAAAREFGAHGYAGARIERIVARAGCNIRMIYHHFGSKAALYRAVVEGAYADLREEEGKLDLDLGDPQGCLDRLLRFTMRYFADHPEFEGIIRSENDQRGRVVGSSRAIGDSGQALKTRLTEIVSAGQARGLFRAGIDPLQLYVTITAMSRFHLANGYSLSAVLGVDLRDAGWRARWADHAVDLIRRYVAADGAAEASASSS
ncbi:MAG: TetR/AcrR family transcriptional regulator [Sphingobium sp.]